jgi:hypothetical protein
MRILRGIGIVSPVLILVPAVWAQAPDGPEFQINTYTTLTQRLGRVASAADGSFVVVWQSIHQDGSSYGVFAQRYDAAGAPAGPEFRVNTFTSNSQSSANVGSAPDGRFVAVWSSVSQDGNSTGVFGQRFDAAGSPAGPEFRANSYITGSQGFPSIGVATDGSFVVSWTSANQDGHLDGVFAQRYDAAGNAQGGEFRVNVATMGSQIGAAVAPLPAGAFLIVWQGGDADNWGIFGRRYDAAGVAQGGEFQINTYTTGSQYSASASASPDGRFVVVWTANDGSLNGVFARRYDAAGVAQGPEFRMNSFTTATQWRPAVAGTADGGFVATWEGDGQDSSGSAAALVRRYDGAGNPEGPEVIANVFTGGDQAGPAIAAQPDGRFVVAWTSDGQEPGFSYSVFGRRFSSSDLIYGNDAESGSLAGWSSSSTDGGDLSVSGSAALKGTAMGLQAAVDDTVGLFVQDDRPVDENRYRARFYFDTNGFDPGETQNHRRTRLLLVFEESPTRRVAAVVLRRLSGSYAILGRARLDDDSQYDTGFFPISDGEHYVELDWRRSTGPEANDGAFELWIDGASVHAATTLDNSVSAVDFVRMGALSVKVGATGTLFFDEFVSRRRTYSGP